MAGMFIGGNLLRNDSMEAHLSSKDADHIKITMFRATLPHKDLHYCVQVARVISENWATVIDVEWHKSIAVATLVYLDWITRYKQIGYKTLAYKPWGNKHSVHEQ